MESAAPPAHRKKFSSGVARKFGWRSSAPHFFQQPREYVSGWHGSGIWRLTGLLICHFIVKVFSVHPEI